MPRPRPEQDAPLDALVESAAVCLQLLLDDYWPGQVGLHPLLMAQVAQWTEATLDRCLPLALAWGILPPFVSVYEFSDAELADFLTGQQTSHRFAKLCANANAHTFESDLAALHRLNFIQSTWEYDQLLMEIHLPWDD